uniref:Uncharacterized protein n=1 Tax=viral metagenome TaxID=1070528 RepID=A0A6M3LPG0_9ZZZZ
MTYASGLLHLSGQSAHRARSMVRGSLSPSASNLASMAHVALRQPLDPRTAIALMLRSNVKNARLRSSGAKAMTFAAKWGLGAASARPPKTRHTLIGMSRSPVGSDSDMANANGQGILNGPLSSSARACTTAMASEVSAASRDPGSNVSISALAASIWQSIDMAYASRSLRSSKSVYAPTTMPRAIFAAAGTRGGFELFMVRVYGAGSMSLNGAKVALTLRQPVQTVSGRYAAPALGFAA